VPQMTQRSRVPLCVLEDNVELAAEFLADDSEHSRRTLVRQLFDNAVIHYAPNVLRYVLGSAGADGFVHPHHNNLSRCRLMPTRYLLDLALRHDVTVAQVNECLELLANSDRVDLTHVHSTVDLQRLRHDQRYSFLFRRSVGPLEFELELLRSSTGRTLPTQSLFYALHQASALLAETNVGSMPPMTLERIEAVLYWLLLLTARADKAASTEFTPSEHSPGASPYRIAHGQVSTPETHWMRRPEYAGHSDVARVHFRCMWNFIREFNSMRLTDVVVQHFGGAFLIWTTSSQERLGFLLPCLRVNVLPIQTIVGYLDELTYVPVSTSVDINLALLQQQAHRNHEHALLRYTSLLLGAGYARTLLALLDDPRRTVRRDIVLHTLLNDTALARLRGTVLRLFANRLLVSIAIALHPLNLPVYVIEEIVQYIAPLTTGLRHIERIRLIERVGVFSTLARDGRTSVPVVRQPIDTPTTTTTTTSSLVADQDQQKMVVERARRATQTVANNCLIAKGALLCNVCLFYRDPATVLATLHMCICRQCAQMYVHKNAKS